MFVLTPAYFPSTAIFELFKKLTVEAFPRPDFTRPACNVLLPDPVTRTRIVESYETQEFYVTGRLKNK